MPRALHRKLLRDLVHLRGQVITIALVIAGGIAFFVAMRGNFSSLLRAQAAGARLLQQSPRDATSGILVR